MPEAATIAGTAAPAPLIWPERDLHAITSVELEPELPGNVEALLPQLHRLAALGDSLRALQAIDGSFTDHAEALSLAAASARLMEEIADSDAVSEEQAEIIRARARALTELRHDQEIAHTEAALGDPQPLTVLAGPLCTFRNKTHAPLHSVIACTAHRGGDELIAALDATSAEVLREVNAKAGTPQVTLGSIFAMQITDLIAMGGESNAFPKHFAYFLPEDEGAGHGNPNKTILFRNAYALRYERISKPLGEALLDGPTIGEGTDVADLLIAWMRGHDIAHAVTTPAAGKVGPKDVGHEPFYSLQEAIANAYGTAMAVTPTWLELAGTTADEMIALYMAESLHYLRRGPWNWSDTGASCIELSFLAANGFIEVREDGVIAWETPRVVEGIHQLCGALERDVVSAQEPAPTQAMLDRFAWHEASPIAPTLRALRDGSGAVPTSLAYL